MMKKTDFGKKVFQEFYMYAILDEKRNTLVRSKFYGDTDECLEAARDKLDEMIKGRLTTARR